MERLRRLAKFANEHETLSMTMFGAFSVIAFPAIAFFAGNSQLGPRMGALDALVTAGVIGVYSINYAMFLPFRRRF